MKLKELIIISVCLVIPLIFSIFLKMNFFITVFASLSMSAIGLYLLKKNKFAGKLLAAASTLGIFMAVGNTVYWILNSIIMVAMMYFYVTTDNIEDTLFKIIVLLSTVTIVGLWNKKNTKEGFLEIASNSLTQRGCQDYCENKKNCKYSVGPKDNSLGICKISQGINQATPARGNTQIWRNKNYVSHTGASTSNKQFASPSSRKYYKGTMITKNYSQHFVPKSVYFKVYAGDQGWGNRTNGIYIQGKMNDKTVFSKNVYAPRTSRPRWWNRQYKVVEAEWDDVNPDNLKINKIIVFARSGGWGHTIHAKNATFTVIGSK